LAGLLIFRWPGHLPPAWGDIPTWISAIATIGLFIGAIFTVIYSIKAFRAQAAELAILAAQRDRDNDERRKAQAARVFIGAPQSPRQTKRGETRVGTVPYVRNTSDLPIYDAEFWDDQPGRDPDDLGVIMPGKKVSTSGKVIYSSRETALSSVILTFSDAAGFRWIRMPDGDLSQQPLADARQSVDAAYRPSLPDGYDRLSDQIAGSVVDAIVVRPRSHGELHMPGKYSYSRDFRVKANNPPEHEVTLTSEDGSSTQGVYYRRRSIGPMERFTLVYDVWNNRDSRVTARLIVPSQADQPHADTQGG
jgi:hypothetical protein